MEELRDPFTRRKTAPIRFNPAPKKPLSAPASMSANNNCGGSSSSSSLTLPRSFEEGGVASEKEYQEFSLVIKKNGPLTMLEFKDSCKFDLEKTTEMAYTRNQLNALGEVWEPKIKKANEEEESKVNKESGPANSVYREKEWEEFRRRKMARKKGWKNNGQEEKRYKEQVTLKVKTSEGSQKVKGIRRPLQTDDEQSLYFAFVPGENGFEAYPVHNWCTLEQRKQTKILSSEEAEAAFKRRSQILDYFNLMVNHRLKKAGGDGDGSDDDGDFGSERRNQLAKAFSDVGEDDVEFMDAADCSSDDSEKGSDDERSVKRQKFHGGKKRKKDVFSMGKDNDAYREYSSTEDSESNDEDDGEETYLLGVDEEDGLRKLLVSDSDSDETGDENNEAKAGKVEGQASRKKKENDKSTTEPKKKGRPRKDSGDKSKDRKENKDSKEQGQGKEETQGGVAAAPLILKRSGNGEWNVSEHRVLEPKKLKGFHVSETVLRRAMDDGITEDALRRYLSRKPITVLELIRKLRRHSSQKITRQETVEVVAYYLRKLKPHHEKVVGTMKFFLPNPNDLFQGTYFSMFGKRQDKH